MADRAPTVAPDAPPLTGRALEIVRWLLAHADEVNAIAYGRLLVEFGPVKHIDITFSVVSRVPLGDSVPR